MAGEAEAAGGFAIHPMDQFVIKPLFGDGPVHWYTPTNTALWMAVGIACVAALFIYATRRRGIIPSRSQSIAELFYEFTKGMVDDVLGPAGAKFFPLIMTIFLFVLMSNLLGLIPMSFTVTSHIAVTAFLALFVFLSVTIIGIARKGLGFFRMFWVSSAPAVVRPILAVLEFISYFVRPISHSVRLAGNMMAGHSVLKVFAGFATVLWVAPGSIAAGVAIYGLELLVAVIQAYIFTILTCVYLTDAVGEGSH